jgi:predicted RNase H-like HicB family nuclease
MRFTAVYQQTSDGGYVAWVEELPGAHAQSDSLDDARKLLAEAVTLVLAANRELAAEYATDGTTIREPLEVPV